jgi:thioredoxin-like negative regulator of GroEL
MPHVKELIAEGYHFNIVDADSEIEMVKAFGIKSIPTFILVEDRMNGAKTKSELIEFFGE